ncbi:exonuclease domain-containing protein [Acetobacter papayae]
MKHGPLEDQARTLQATGAYRVLRRIAPLPLETQMPRDQTRVGIFLDLETTGLDPIRDEIIEFGLVPFVYTLDGRILGTLPVFSRLREPSQPIPPEITALTGITQEMVAGKTITPEEIARFVAPAALIVAHNARFDRPFAERFWEGFSTRPWACSMEDVPGRLKALTGAALAIWSCRPGGFLTDTEPPMIVWPASPCSALACPKHRPRPSPPYFRKHGNPAGRSGQRMHPLTSKINSRPVAIDGTMGQMDAPKHGL